MVLYPSWSLVKGDNHMSNFVLSRIFEAHQWLWAADSYSRYEERQDSLRSGAGFFDVDPEIANTERFRFLLPFVISAEKLEAAYRCEYDVHLERLADIENTYRVFKRSIDFEVKLGNSLKRVLAKPRKAGPTRHLLSSDEFSHVKDIISSVREWEIESPSFEGGLSFWETLYLAQKEIEESGRVSEASRAALQRLNEMKPKNSRLYARPLLFILLAEFFDDFSCDELETSISDCSTEDEWNAKTVEKIKTGRKYFASPFARFLAEFYAFIEVDLDGEISKEVITELTFAAETERSDDDALSDWRQQITFNKLLYKWRVDKWHEKLGFERGMNLRRRSQPSIRITEGIISGCDAAGLLDVLAILDLIKTHK